jgi:very-short-patch-repair endonuclease
MNWDEVKRLFEVEYLPVTTSMSLSDRFNAIRKNYRTYQAEVDAGHAGWMQGNDPYEIANWPALFTPIESAAWQDIRQANLPLWPQLPVGRFFVDFGNPVVKVALECDGAKFHDADKDAARDAELRGMGWFIYRVPGWRCNKVMDSPAEIRAQDREPTESETRAYMAQTMGGIIEHLKGHFQ